MDVEERRDRRPGTEQKMSVGITVLGSRFSFMWMSTPAAARSIEKPSSDCSRARVTRRAHSTTRAAHLVVVRGGEGRAGRVLGVHRAPLPLCQQLAPRPALVREVGGAGAGGGGGRLPQYSVITDRAVTSLGLTRLSGLPLSCVSRRPAMWNVSERAGAGAGAGTSEGSGCSEARLTGSWLNICCCSCDSWLLSWLRLLSCEAVGGGKYGGWKSSEAALVPAEAAAGGLLQLRELEPGAAWRLGEELEMAHIRSWTRATS